MNAKQFGEKYGKKYIKKIPTWYSANYLGATTKDEKTGVYSIPDDIPLPYSADKRITKLPTLWKQILDAATKMCSLYPSMYPKLPTGVFDRQLQGFVEAGFIRISQTESGDVFLELQPAGYEYLHRLSDSEKSRVFKIANEAVKTGCVVAQAFIAAWPYLQQIIQQQLP